MKKITSVLTLLSLGFCCLANASDDGNLPFGGLPEKAAKDLPASVTVITRKDIVVLGIQDMTELLALIPGFSTSKRSAAVATASYHGTNAQLPRRTKYMVDGLTLQSVGYDSYNWARFPISIEDIERVEVYRNQVDPKSGSKSLQATVNIITRNPADTNKAMISGNHDSIGKSKLSSMYSGSLGGTAFSVRAEKSEDDGFSYLYRKNKTGGTDKLALEDGLNSTKLNLRTSTEINSNIDFQVLAGMMKADSDLSVSDANSIGPTDRDMKQYFGAGTLKIKGDADEYRITLAADRYDETKEWKTCYPLIMFTDELRAMYKSNPVYAETLLAGLLPKGGSKQDDLLALTVLKKAQVLGATAKKPECGDVNENFNEAKNKIDIENTHVFNDRLTLTSGYEYQNNFFDSQTLTGREISYTSQNLHTSAYVNVTDTLGLSLGGNYSSISMMGDKDTGASYQVGLNYDYLERHTVKIVHTNTHRSPVPLERHLNWTYYMSNFTLPFDGKTGGLFYKTTTSLGYPVKNENYDSNEINFSGFLKAQTIEYDVKLFSETMDDLISEDLLFVNFKPTNSNEAKLKGAEALVKYHFSPLLKLQLGGSYIDNNTTSENEKSLWLRNVGHASLMYAGAKNQFSVTYYSSSGLYDNTLHRLDANYRHEFAMGKAKPYFNIKVRYEPSDFVFTPKSINGTDSSRSTESVYLSNDESTTVLFGLGVNL